MAFRANGVRGYNFTSHDRLFLDANVWLYIFCPLAQQREGDERLALVYSDAFDDILKAQGRIYIDILIVSEFINRYARLEHQQRPGDMPFKRFRKSPDFEPVAQTIGLIAGKVLGCCSWLESGEGPQQIEDALAQYRAGKTDFNDQIIAALCKRENLTLMTHDGDFRHEGLSILTENRRLLNQSP